MIVEWAVSVSVRGDKTQRSGAASPSPTRLMKFPANRSSRRNVPSYTSSGLSGVSNQSEFQVDRSSIERR
jgi:hypothetical protein